MPPPQPQKFTTRPLAHSSNDTNLLISFRDSQIAWLTSQGSGDQWGPASVRESRPDVVAKTEDWVRRSQDGGEWGAEWVRGFVAEVEREGGNGGDDVPTSEEPAQAPSTSKTPVAALVLTSTAPEYVSAILPQQDTAQPFVYLAYLISNRRVAEVLTKGAGAFLIEVAKEEVRKLGLGRLCLDCWRGNGGRLVRYYESQGFKAVGDFVASEKDWPGTVMEMRL